MSLHTRLPSLLNYVVKPSQFNNLVLVVLAFSTTIFAAMVWYPGWIADDAMTQYLQALKVAPLSDSHPPLMAIFWRLEIYLLHTANLLNLTWISLSSLGFVLFLRLKPCLLSLGIFLIISLSPFIFGMNAFVYKDLPLSWLLLISSALLCTIKQKTPNKFIIQILISILLTLCCLLRANAVFVVTPLMIATWIPWRISFQNIIICLLLLAVLIPGSMWVNNNLFKADKNNAITWLQIFDLAGISYYSKYSSYHDKVETKISTHRRTLRHWRAAPLSEKLAVCYTPTLVDSFGGWVLPGYEMKERGWNKWATAWNATLKPSQWRIHYYSHRCINLQKNTLNDPEKVYSMWIRAIRDQPKAYLKHRIKHFMINYWNIAGGSGPWGYGGRYPVGEHDKMYFIKPNINWVATKYINFSRKHPKVWWNYGIFWVLPSVVLFCATFRQTGRTSSLINCFCFSGICYWGGYLFIGIANSWRYIMPSAILLISSFLAWYISGEKIASRKSWACGGCIGGAVLMIHFFYNLLDI